MTNNEIDPNDPQPELEEEGRQDKEASQGVLEEIDEAAFQEELANYQTKPLRLYNVIVDNDDFHTVEYVVKMLQDVCKLSEQDAIKAAQLIHEEGKAIVFQGNLEVCELKSQQISNYGKDDLAIKSGVNCQGSMTSYVQPQ